MSELANETTCGGGYGVPGSLRHAGWDRLGTTDSSVDAGRAAPAVSPRIGAAFLAAVAPSNAASPSLPSAGSSGGASELKFVVDEATALRVREWSRRHLAADPHADPTLGDGAEGYLVNTLYLDTPGLDVFHRTGLLGPRKYRIRRYGRESAVWIELKRKRGGVVRKRRVAVDESELVSRLCGPADPAWDGLWFRQRVERHALAPVCRVTYRRFARMGHTPAGTIRLTIDDEVRGQAANGWWVPDAPLRTPCLLEGERIVELKFRGGMPALFRGLVMDLGLTPGSFSKYREAAADSVPLSRLVPAASEEPDA